MKKAIVDQYVALFRKWYQIEQLIIIRLVVLESGLGHKSVFTGLALALRGLGLETQGLGLGLGSLSASPISSPLNSTIENMCTYKGW